MGSITSFLILILISYVSSLHPPQFDVSWTDGGDISSPAKTIFMAAVFHYNNKLFVFGDYTNKKSLFEYDISSEQFTDFGTSTLAYEIAGYSQFWTQIGNIGYIIGHYSTNQKNLYIYDLSTKSLTTTLTIEINTSGSEACLASGNNMLFVLGGIDPACSPDPSCEAIDSDLRIVQIYDLSSQQWFPNGPLMKWQRDEFACIVINDYLYAFGGRSWFDKQQWPSYGGLTDKIEKIQITDIFNNAWAYTPDLLIKISKHRAVIFGDYIVVIGGQSYDSGLDTYSAVDKIQLVNTISDVVSYAGGSLNKAVYSTAPILINNIIYAFGGIGATGGLNTWQYITLESDAPTSVPTQNPTNNPTIFPTSVPTNNPTRVPTFNPTRVPTDNPTKNPSRSPTDNPTKNPTQGPTVATDSPSGAPTENTGSPTKAPSRNPIEDGITSNPSEAPTTEDQVQGGSAIILNTIRPFIIVTLLIIFSF